MDAKRLLSIQAERGAKAIGMESMQRSIESEIIECRKFIQDNSEKYRDLEPQQKRNVIKELIVTYVMNHTHIVEGYVDEENRPDTNKLVDRLVEDITDYGILTPAILNNNINEIRSNGKEIKIESEGRIHDLTDKDGNIVAFDSVEQQDIIMRKLLGDVRLTPKDALVNARTVEGYRIAAVHSSVMSPDPDDPTEQRYHSFVLRKHKMANMHLAELVKYGSLSDSMARFLKLAPEAGLTTICAGPTASGKTTLLNAILKYEKNRVILVQNPSEIDIRIKDSSGRVVNDVLHLEATDKASSSPNDPTTENIMAHILRLSPTDVCLGELRTNKEMALGMMIMGAGHPMFASLHAEDSKGVIDRYLRGYMAASNEMRDTALPGLTDLLKLVVIQKIMKDGTRKVLQITEVLGVDKDNMSMPLLNDLFIFEPDSANTTYFTDGRVKDIPGKHKRVGKLHDETIKKFKLAGIHPNQYDFMMKDISADEVETYTGENIENYGMQLR